MKRNIKNLFVFIIAIIILTIIAGTTLAASKSTGRVKGKNDSTAVSSQSRWSGLGLGMFSWEPYTNDDIDKLLANGFAEIRIDIPDFQDNAKMEESKKAVTYAVVRGAKVIWGVSSNKYNNPDYAITSSSWASFRQAILDAAKWAQDNGVYEFQLGNEEEYHIDETTMTQTQIIADLKSVAKDAQSIFTNGKISYSCGRYPIPDWVSAGKGDIDILALNIYMGDTTFSDNWKIAITDMINAFGPGGTYLTEFNLSSISLDSYSSDETVQVAGLSSMIEYIKGSGMTRALFFTLRANEFGAMKSDGSYRLLWEQALKAS
ncbi:MAG: hypothetical protein M1308_16270 [Actinobacteria bacterium]|nr:hypothetical protein [Actinomycetota bacterium]